MSATDVGQVVQQAVVRKWRDLVTAGVDARFIEAGYMEVGEVRHYGSLISKLTDLVLKARVSSEGEKADKAISRGTLVAEAFPELPNTKDAWRAEDDPELAEEVYDWIERKVWDLAKSDATGPVQQEVGDREPGLLLCHAQIGSDHTPSAYVTDDKACFIADFNEPLAKKVERMNERMAANMAMAVKRLPKHVRVFERAYENANKDALEAGRGVMRPALEAAKDDQAENDK